MKQFKTVLYRTDDGCRVALIAIGRTLITACITDAPVRLIRVPMSEQRHMRALSEVFPGESDNQHKTVRALKRAAKHLGITASAKVFLREASHGNAR